MMNIAKNIIVRLWHSPTFNTWISTGARTLSFILVLPILLRRFSPAELAVWYLFAAFADFSFFVDIGFSPTFGRFIAYAMGGAKEAPNFKLKSAHRGDDASPNYDLMGEMVATMRGLFASLSLLVFLGYILVGTMVLYRPISATQNSIELWQSWAVTSLAAPLSFFGTLYFSFLEGCNFIALLRRMQGFFAVLAVIAAFIVLFFGGGFLELTITFCVINLIVVFVARQICRHILSGAFKRFGGWKINLKTLKSIWTAAWRSGVGTLAYRFSLQLAGFVYAQFGSPVLVASYLFSLKIMNTLIAMSIAPFYSKIFLLPRLHAQNRINEMLAVAREGMRLTYILYATAVIGVGVGLPLVLSVLGSKTPFVSPVVWALMGLAYFFDRYGAMHMRIYETTNHILTHKQCLGFFVIYLPALAILFPIMGIIAIPLSMMCGSLGFYGWYAAKYSYRLIPVSFWEYEKSTSIVSLCLLLLYLCTALID